MRNFVFCSVEVDLKRGTDRNRRWNLEKSKKKITDNGKIGEMGQMVISKDNFNQLFEDDEYEQFENECSGVDLWRGKARLTG